METRLMRTALVTTSINVPTVLALYRKLDPNVKLFVAADEKTPLEAYTFCADIPDCEIYSPERQKDLGYEHSELIGWNTDSRRNIALLEALKWGAEIIVSADDDMIFSDGSFVEFNSVFSTYELVTGKWIPNTYDGLQLGAPNQWFDAGWFTIPPPKQRGLPFDMRFASAAESVVDAKIGVAQGIILGVPDTDACTSITSQPFVHSASDILRSGFVVHPHAHAVFNSQLTAFRRELAPAFAQFYNHQGRNTDILASVLMRRIMRDRDLYTYFGLPCGFHARQPRPLFNDLKAEMYGLERIAGFSEFLWHMPTQQHSITDDCRDLIAAYPMFSDDLKEAAFAWYNDVEKVL